MESIVSDMLCLANQVVNVVDDDMRTLWNLLDETDHLDEFINAIENGDGVACHSVITAMYIFDSVSVKSVVADKFNMLYSEYIALKKLNDENVRINNANDRCIVALLAFENYNPYENDEDEVVGVDMC